MLTALFKILIIPGYRLYPPNTGAGIAQFDYIDELRHHVHLSVLLSPVNVADDQLEELQSRWSNVRFFFWKNDFPNGKAPVTIFERIRDKTRRTLEPTQSKLEKKRSEKYQEIYYNVENLMVNTPDWMLEQLDQLLTREKFDLIQCDLPINMGLASTIGNRAKKLFVHHEIKYERVGQLISGKESDASQLKKLQKQLKKVEINKLNSFDAIQVFTAEDQAILDVELAKPIEVAKFGLSQDKFRKSEDGESLKRLVFIGSDEHAPNLDGFDWFVKEIWNDGVEAGIKLHVIGKWSAANIEKYQSENIEFHGFVDRLHDWCSHAVLVAPIRQGAGLRTKIMESLASSMPVLSTSFATTGIDNEKKVVQRFENVNEFYEVLKKLKRNVEYFQSLQKASYHYAEEHLSNASIVQKRLFIYKKLLT